MIVFKEKYAGEGIPDFYTFCPRERFPKLLVAASRIISMFGSTYMYVCEQICSSVKKIF